MLLQRGQQPEARKAFEKSIEISPDYLPATEMLVDLDLAAKQYAPAIERVQKLIDKDPKLAQPWGLRGKIYLAQQDFTQAEADLLKAIDLDPNLSRHTCCSLSSMLPQTGKKRRSQNSPLSWRKTNQFPH